MDASSPLPARESRAARSSEPPVAARGRMLALLRQFGWNITSFQVLEPGLHYWFRDPDAAVAYVDTGHSWVAAGAPIAEDERLPDIALAFCEAARRHDRRVAFFATERRFVESLDLEAVLVGEQPIFDPSDYQKTLASSRSLREQLRRARAKGVVVERIAPEQVADPVDPMRVEIEALIARWIGTKPMPPLGFLVRVHPFNYAAERRLFVARRGNEVVGFAGVIPVYARKGWFIEDLIRSPKAPNGTIELLVDAAIRDAAALGSGYLTLGLSPLSGPVEDWLRVASKYGAAFYDFAGLHAFKAKFRPREWVPIYLSYPRDQSSHIAIYDSLVAFAQRGLLRYGLEALLRGPRIVVHLLAALLIPWTLLLASIDGARWFPFAWMKWFWVGFDIALATALFWLSARFRPWLASVILFLVLADALVTIVQTVAFDLPRVGTTFEAGALFLAVLAPVLATVVLSNARERALRVLG